MQPVLPTIRIKMVKKVEKSGLLGGTRFGRFFGQKTVVLWGTIFLKKFSMGRRPKIFFPSRIQNFWVGSATFSKSILDLQNGILKESPAHFFPKLSKNGSKMVQNGQKIVIFASTTPNKIKNIWIGKGTAMPATAE